MSRTPDQESLGVKIPGAVRQLEHFNPEAMAAPGRALQQVGKSIAGLGESIGGAIGALDAQNSKDEEYATHTRFLDFDQAQSDRYESEKRNMAPDGMGFRDTITKSYDDGARAFFKDVPDRLKPKYDYMLRQRGIDYERRSRDDELKQNDTHHFNDVNTRLDAYRGMTDENPDDIRDNIGRGLSLIEASKLPPQMKAKLKQEFTTGVEKQSIERRLQRGDDPLEVMKDLQARPKIQEPVPGQENENDRPGGLPEARGVPQSMRPRGGMRGGQLPVGGSMSGKSWDDVPEDGGRPKSRAFGGPRPGGLSHAGWDVPGNTGDPVMALTGGTVLRAGQGQGYGHMVDVLAPDGTVHRFAHLDSIAVRDGQKIEPGGKIGALGYSGNAGREFPHVHIEVFDNKAKYEEAAGQSSRVAWRLRSDAREYYRSAFGGGEGGGSVANAAPAGGSSRIPAETMGAVASVAKGIGADPSAIGAVFTMESGPDWNPKTRTGQYTGVSQVGNDTLREMGMTREQYDKLGQAGQAQFYGKWLEHYSFSQKMKDAGIDFSKQKPERQAAILQAFQFAPNGDWIRRLGNGDTSSPVTEQKQARALGSTSIADMERHFSGNMAPAQPVQVADGRSEDRGQMLWKQGKEDGAHLDQDGHDPTRYDANGDPLDGTTYYRDKPGRYVTTDERPPGTLDLKGRALTAQGRNDMKVADAAGTTVPTPKSFIEGNVAGDGKTAPGPAAQVTSRNGMPIGALTDQGQVATILDGIPDSTPLSAVPPDVHSQIARMVPPDAFKARQMPDGSTVSAADAVTVGDVKRAIAAPLQDAQRATLPEARVAEATAGRPAPTFVDNPKYRWLREADREILLRKAEMAMRNKILTQAQGEIAQIKESGEESRDATGQTFLERSRTLLMPNQYEKARIQIEGAKWHYQAVSGIKTMPESDIEAHLANIRPTQADAADLEKYKIKSDAYHAALKERDKVQDLRDKNGALAADADSRVQQVWQTIRNAKTQTMAMGTGGDGKLQTWTDEFSEMTPTQARERLVEARLAAQERFFGSKTDLRIRTITKREAEDLLGLRSAAGIGEDQLLQHLKMGADRADKMYGQYAERAFKDAVGMLIHSKEGADSAAGVMKKQLQGRPVSAGDMQRYQMMQDLTPSQQFLVGSGSTRPRAAGAPPTSVPRDLGQGRGPTMDGMRPGPGPVQAGPAGRPAIMDAAQIGVGGQGAPQPGMARGAEPVTINQAGPRALQWLMQAPTDPNRIRQFDSQFGAGAAQQHIDWLKTQVAKQPGMLDKLKGMLGR